MSACNVVPATLKAEVVGFILRDQPGQHKETTANTVITERGSGDGSVDESMGKGQRWGSLQDHCELLAISLAQTQRRTLSQAIKQGWGGGVLTSSVGLCMHRHRCEHTCHTHAYTYTHTHTQKERIDVSKRFIITISNLQSQTD